MSRDGQVSTSFTSAARRPKIERDSTIVDSWLGTNFIPILALLGSDVAPFGHPVPGPEA